MTDKIFDDELELTLNLAFKESAKKRYEYLTVEYLMLALLDNPSAARILRSCGADIDILREQLSSFLEKTTPVIDSSSENTQPQTTLGVQRVLQRAVFRAQAAGKQEVSGSNVLAALFGEEGSRSIYFLEKAGIKEEDVEKYLGEELAQFGRGEGLKQSFQPAIGIDEGERGGEIVGSVLSQYTVNLNLKAKRGKIDPVIGRDAEILEVIQILTRRRKNNPLLVGEPGVGKTAIAEGLARLIVEKHVPPNLEKTTIYSLDMGGLLAGTQFRGEFEKRLTGILEAVSHDPNAILFIDEIHTIIGAGATGGNSMDVANLLKPLLASGELKCIGSTTYQEYRSIFEKDRALARRFQKIDVHEPSVSEAIQILKGLRSRFQNHYRLTFTDEALEAAVELANRYITDRFLPDKAIDIIDEAGAAYMLLPKEQQNGEVNKKMIEGIVAKIARIPEVNVSRNDRAMIRSLDENLKSVVFGQDQAIDALVAAVKLSLSGLREENKTIGSFLFAGPTGVGKTEVVRQLAKSMGVELLRYDMSEYMERHTVSRLIGAPPGYVGYDQGGLLTDAVNQHPYSVVLLDEIEKAHSDIYNLLLQVMDNGALTDSNGRKVDFRHTVLIMTTNAGARALSRPGIGFTPQDHLEDGMDELNRLFTPEFRNRLDAIIQFKPLDLKTIANVVNKFVHELKEQLRSKGVEIEITEAACLWLAEHGYDRDMGARPMARLIQEYVKKPIAEELLFGKLAEGGRVSVGVKENKITVGMDSCVLV